MEPMESDSAGAQLKSYHPPHYFIRFGILCASLHPTHECESFNEFFRDVWAACLRSVFLQRLNLFGNVHIWELDEQVGLEYEIVLRHFISDKGMTLESSESFFSDDLMVLVSIGGGRNKDKVWLNPFFKTNKPFKNLLAMLLEMPCRVLVEFCVLYTEDFVRFVELFLVCRSTRKWHTIDFCPLIYPTTYCPATRKLVVICVGRDC